MECCHANKQQGWLGNVCKAPTLSWLNKSYLYLFHLKNLCPVFNRNVSCDNAVTRRRRARHLVTLALRVSNGETAKCTRANSKTWLTFHIRCPLAPNSLSLSNSRRVYSSPWPPSSHSLPLCEISHCLQPFSSINLWLFPLPFYPSSRLWSKVTSCWLSFIFCIAWHPLVPRWVCLCYGLFRLLYNSSFPSPPIFHSSQSHSNNFIIRLRQQLFDSASYSAMLFTDCPWLF